jgi:septum formation protein
MRGRTGSLLTGHCLVDMRPDSSEAARTEEVGCAQVRFGEPDDVELAAYVASGEPMAVAGGFTIDGLGGWFVDSVTGAPSTVVGLSLPVLRRLLAAHGVSVADLWAARQRAVRS